MKEVQEVKPKTIRVSSDTMKKLGDHRNGFETPDECLQRILSKNPCKPKEETEDEDEEA
ncbi:MAG: hypothetical protein YK1309IOTA_450002 [Marine Group I thaumarchaeote]|nr:MAG: hypothetical protein YK1309IOTA_450002 [Marine Group I thaumarchaeote]